MDWYYAGGSERVGPFSSDQMAALLAAGTLRPDTPVWHQGLTNWITASDAFPAVPSPIPVPPPAPAPWPEEPPVRPEADGAPKLFSPKWASSLPVWQRVAAGLGALQVLALLPFVAYEEGGVLLLASSVAAFLGALCLGVRPKEARVAAYVGAGLTALLAALVAMSGTAANNFSRAAGLNVDETRFLVGVALGAALVEIALLIAHRRMSRPEGATRTTDTAPSLPGALGESLDSELSQGSRFDRRLIALAVVGIAAVSLVSYTGVFASSPPECSAVLRSGFPPESFYYGKVIVAESEVALARYLDVVINGSDQALGDYLVTSQPPGSRILLYPDGTRGVVELFGTMGGAARTINVRLTTGADSGKSVWAIRRGATLFDCPRNA